MNIAFEQQQQVVAQTLVHFLWQGFALVALAAAGFRIYRNASANVRYVIGVCAMLAMALAPIATTVVLVSLASKAAPETTGAPSAPGSQSAAAPAAVETPTAQKAFVVFDGPIARPAVTGDGDPSRSAMNWAEAHKTWIVAGWCAGVLLLGLRLLLGFVGLYRWSWPRAELPGELQAVVDRLTIALRMGRARVFLNPRVPEALALGIFRPVVLVPTSWATGLPVSMLEAILAHELAHVRRHDLLVNLVQRLVETFLFYHPAVWWLSARIRQERELCCDALAVAVTGNRLIYAQTLEHVARLEANSASWGWALGIGGRRMHLLHRVQKVLGAPPSQRGRSWPAGLLAIVAVLVLGGLAILSKPQTTSAQEHADEETGIVVDAQGAPAKGVRIRAFDDGERIRELTADVEGRFRFPRSWRSDSRTIALVVRDGARLGWNMPSRQRAGKDGKLPDIRIVLVPVDRRVEGVLHDEKGRPISDAQILPDHLTHETNGILFGSHAGPELDFLASKSDKTGRFQAVLPSGSGIELHVRHPDFAAARIGVSKDKNDAGTIAVPPGGRIAGRVADATGAPIRAAHVGAQLVSEHAARFGGGVWGEAVSDEKGQYVISGLLPGQYNVLFSGVVKNQKLVAPGREGIQVEAGKAAVADFVVVEGRKLSGSVVDLTTGKPLADWHVGYYGADRPQSGAACRMVKTDAKGNYEFFVSPGPSYVYVAQGHQVAAADSHRTVEVPKDRDLANIVLQASTKTDQDFGISTICISPEDQKKRDENQDFRLRIELRAPEGSIVNGVIYRQIRNRRREVGSGIFSGSRFVSETWGNTARGTYSLVIDADGFAPVHTKEFEFARRMEPLVVDLKPAVHVPVRGRVLDPDGNPLAGARVRAGRVIVLDSTEFPWGVEAITDASGTYELKGLRQGERLYVYAEKDTLGGIQSKQFLLEEKEPLTLPDLRIPRADQSISGSVKAQDGAPVVGAEVVIRNAYERKSDASKKARTDADGRFRLEGLLPGRVSLDAKAPGYRTRFPIETKTGETKVDVFMSSDREQEPAFKRPAASVEFKTSDGSVVGDAAYWWITVGKGQGSAGGTVQGNKATVTRYGSNRLESRETYALVFAPRGYAFPKPAIVKPEDFGKPLTIALEPAAPVALIGRVVDDDGRPLAGVRVGLSLVLMNDVAFEQWRDSSGIPSRELPVTDAEGRFRVTSFEFIYDSMSLPPGATVAAYVNKPGYAGVLSKRVTLAKGDDTSLGDIRLPVSRRSVTGTVVDEGGKAVAGADVKVRGFGDVRTKTAKDGSFRLEAAPHGRLTLRVDGDGFPLEYAEAGADQNDVRVRLRGAE